LDWALSAPHPPPNSEGPFRRCSVAFDQRWDVPAGIVRELLMSLQAALKRSYALLEFSFYAHIQPLFLA
jgi:hypothetical protein